MATEPGYILVVDDQNLNRMTLAHVLQQQGHKCATAADGSQALAMLRAERFDLVLLDIMMPGIDGYETCRQLKADPATREVTVIFLSALDETHDKVRGLDLGAVDYITKPFQINEVIARVNTHLTIHHLQQRLARSNKELDTANRFIRQTFGRYMTDEVAASVLDNPDGLQLGGEERKVTILMSDLRGFTSLAERLSQAQVVAFLNCYLETMVNVIMAYQGTIADILGDGIVVLFGAPMQREDDARRAVACAVAMQLAMATVNAQGRDEGLPDVEMGIGIHTGNVVVGNIGSQKLMKYGVVGSHVNLTSRIESYTTGNQILISETTRDEVGPLLRLDGQMQVEPKGVREVLTIYEVGGIGDPYNLFLPEKHDTFVRLNAALDLRYTVLEEKHVSRTAFTGRLVKLSTEGGVIHSDHHVPVWSNIKIWFTDSNGGEIPGDLYGKVVAHPMESAPCFTVRFTSRAPEVTAFLQRFLASFNLVSS